MNLLAFSDNAKVLESLTDAISGSVHTLETMDLPTLTANSNISSYDGIITDRKTWQRSSVLLKYFGALERINNMPLMILAVESKKVRVKFRDSQHPLVQCSYPVVQDEVLANIEKLISIVPQES